MLMLSIPQQGLADEPIGALKVPESSVILSINGDINHRNVLTEARFDRDMLSALPQHSFETGTPWTEGSSAYSGPLMRTLLESVGSVGDSVHVSALNGYEAQIPISDFYEYDVILALERDGQSIPIREYGPLWVLYPFSQDEALLSEKMRFRAVWQVMQIHVH
ncbi:oxidoreductase [Vreelandella andesensis]|uniref:Oxidoreductase n=1 Tax=Vreelandella andesensis TaxID=447567 RepID=A0A3S0XXJ9_9GAMM|nr:molybdopterin-dependent oxidoreductase [Halomonas andesensis]RUR26858.1 oxidoreductase [Halomonas andesensis]